MGNKVTGEQVPEIKKGNHLIAFLSVLFHLRQFLLNLSTHVRNGLGAIKR